MSDAYEQLLERVRDLGRLEAIEGLLSWDQETYMPPKGAGPRAEEVALIAGLMHRWLTDPALGDLLDRARADGDPVRETNIRETRRLYERAVRVPNELVREIAKTSTLAKGAWAEAREKDAFDLFAPHLSRLVDLKRQVAEHIGYDGEPYDALMDEFEPGARAEAVAALFADLRRELVPLLQAITGSGRRPDESILRRHYPRAAQEALCRELAETLGYDFSCGRLDVSVHPFTSGHTPLDVRITTRFYEDFLPAGLFGTIHEVGHALYEQGLNPEYSFTPMGRSVSLGIHESQSRMWENIVGRSRAFWEHFYPRVRQCFPQALGDVALDDFVFAVNAVKPSLIRVEADEVTYNLHIIVRFELERDLIAGRLDVADVPRAWNEKMGDLVGVRPPDNRQGCLQDIHWSMGVFGYFPTYALGNLYAAQFFEAARRDVPDLTDRIRRGDLRTLLEWLRENIHRHGQRYRAGELAQRLTGRDLSVEPFMTYLREKFTPLYGL